MALILKYRNRAVYSKDITFIQRLIAINQDYGRCALSKEICRNWNWVQPNGQLKDMICRGLLLHLERQGYIKLPPRKYTPQNPFLTRKKPDPIDVNNSLLKTNLNDIRPISIRQVRRTVDEKLFNGLIEQYHYLGYTRPVGEHLKYIAFSQDRPIACLAFSSAARHLGCRDHFIGWDPETRKRNIHFLAYNTRFLILPWVRISCLASYLLSRCARIVSSDWQRIYSHPLYWLETMVDTQYFQGICYQAANWVLLGKTTGRGLNDRTNKVNRSIKSVYGYPLVAGFRQKLGVVQ
jgi:hypothetical protein